MCTVSVIKDCDVLAVYNFFGETFLCRLTGGGKDKLKPFRLEGVRSCVAEIYSERDSGTEKWGSEGRHAECMKTFSLTIFFWE